MPVVQRQGQPEFRNRLIEAYGGRCAITGCDAIDALEAAHISPYLGPKTNHVSNGLLLRADIHTLFDRGLLGIDEQNLTVVLHPSLKATTYREYAGKAIHLPTRSDQQPSKDAVRHHRQQSGL
jgi:predicted restriction endonuclease